MKRLFALWIGILVSWWSALASAQSQNPSQVPSPWLAPRRPDGTTYAAPSNDAATSSDAGASDDAGAAPSSDASATSATQPTASQGNATQASSAQATAATVTAAQTSATNTARPDNGSTPGATATSPTAANVATQPSVSATPEPRRVSLTRARLRLLDASFAGLAGRSSSQRILDGIVSIGAGAVMVGSSFVIPATPGLTDLRPWLWATSGYLALQGIVNLAWAPARERLSRQYEALPATTAAQRRERLRFGEHALDDIAADGHRRRILAGVANIAATGGLLTVAYADTIFNGVPRSLSLTDAVVLTYGGVAIVLHVVQMLSMSEEERLRNSYFQQLELLRAERRSNPG